MSMRLRLRGAAGNGLIEFAIVLPLIIVLVLGVVEVSYALLDQHIVTKLTREGSNLISRDTDLPTAATALRNMATPPVNFDNGSSKVIFSVIRNVSKTGAANYNKSILYARYEYGSLSGSSQLTTAGNGAFGGGNLPGYQASDPNGDTNLRLTNMPVAVPLGGWLYVTEIYTKHDPITPFDQFGVTLPRTLYSVAIF